MSSSHAIIVKVRTEMLCDDKDMTIVGYITWYNIEAAERHAKSLSDKDPHHEYYVYGNPTRY